MTVLVTGCAGFIGSHLTERLLEAKKKVIGVDLLTDTYPSVIKINNVAPAKKHWKNLSFYPHIDVRDINGSSYPVKGKEIDAIYHLAARPGVRESWNDFKEYSRNNIEGTQAMLEFARKIDVKKFVFASSSSVYGDVKKLPMAEEDIPRPASPYGVTKEACEKLCRTYHQAYGLPVVMLRYFTVYGPRQRPDMAFMKWIDAIKNGTPVVVYGNGEQTRDFTYVSDAVEATFLAGQSKLTNEIINVGGGSEVTVNQAICALEEIIGKNFVEAKIKYIENQKGDVRDTLADTNKLRNVLNYKTKVKLKEGLENQVEWYNSVNYL